MFSVLYYFGCFPFPWGKGASGYRPVWRYVFELREWVETRFVGKMGERIRVGEGTIIHPTAVIEGPVVIGKNCVIGPHAYLRGPVLLMDNCKVGHASEVKNSIFLDKAKAPHRNYVGDSILGIGVNLGTGSSCLNYLGSGRSIVLPDGTQLRKFGAVIGNRTSIGGGVMINPGTFLGRDCRVLPTISVPPRIYPHGTVIKFARPYVEV